MTKILMVCLGNICRSPLAEGILKSKVDTERIYVDSAGTAGYHEGDLPDPRSIRVAEQNGINIKNQRSRKLTIADLENFDFIYAMDKSNFTNILALAETNEQKEKVKLLLAEADLGVLEVPDPYYGGDKGFDYVYGLIDDACNHIVKNLTDAGK